MNNLVLIDLANRFKEHDESSFAPIYENFIGLIKYFSFKSYGEDMEQDLLLFLVKFLYAVNLSHFCPDESTGLERYITVSLRNEYILKSKANQTYLSNKDFSENVTLVHKDKLHEKLFIWETLDRLTPQQRKIMIYKYIYKYSDIEIAAMLNISRQAVNRLKKRSIESLRKNYTN